MKNIKEYIERNRLKLLIIQIVLLLIGIVAGVSYAYFSYNLEVVKKSDTVIISGSMEIEFEDGPEVKLENAVPTQSVTKKFKIRNVGTASTIYDVYLSELINDFVDKTDLVYEIKSVDGGYNTESDEEVPGTVDKIISNCLIEPGKVHNYELIIKFKETNDNQDDNKGVYFSSKLQVNEVKKASKRIRLNIGENAEGESEIPVIINETMSSLPTPRKVGYTFKGWHLDSELTKEVTSETVFKKEIEELYAKWEANNDTTYKVLHYQMDTSGNYPETAYETENLSGTTDTKVTPEVKTYTGFTSPSSQEVNIDADGTKEVKYYYERNKYVQKTQGRYMNTSGNYGDYSNLDTKDVYYGATYSYSKDATVEYNAASVSSYTVTGEKTNSIDISRRQYAQKTQGRYMNTSGNYGNYSDLETKNVYYGASYSYSKAATAEYAAASVAAYTVTGEKTNQVSFARRQYAQTTQGRYMNTSGAYGGYSNIESKNVYYGASYSYSKAATAEYNAASVAAYTVTAAKTNQISFSRRQYTQTTQGRYMNTSGTYGGYSNLESKNVYYGANYSYSKAATAEYAAASVAAYKVTGAKTNQISFARRAYTISFNGNGGSVSPTSRSVYYNASTTLPTPSRTNYSFNGWYTAASGGSKYGNAGASYKVTAAKTMYAQWARNDLNLLGYANHPSWNLTNFSWFTCDGCSAAAKVQLNGDSPGGCCDSSCNATGTTKTAITSSSYNITDLNKLNVEWWHNGASSGPSYLNVYLCSSPSSCTGSLASHTFPKHKGCTDGSSIANSGGTLTANITNYNGNYYVKVVVTHDVHGGGQINIGRVYLTR